MQTVSELKLTPLVEWHRVPRNVHVLSQRAAKLPIEKIRVNPWENRRCEEAVFLQNTKITLYLPAVSSEEENVCEHDDSSFRQRRAEIVKFPWKAAREIFFISIVSTFHMNINYVLTRALESQQWHFKWHLLLQQSYSFCACVLFTLTGSK